MTSLPYRDKNAKKLGLAIDLDVCVGCHACVVNCKEWNTGGAGSALSDQTPFGKSASGTWLNRIHSYEYQDNAGCDQTTYFPKSCLHCENAACVTVCPTGASFKRQEDGIVLVDEDKCIGCGLCAWACPYGARELDQDAGVMKKCTLCVDRIYDESLDEEERQPACVRTCPSKARHFGDLNDPKSDISQFVAKRDSANLMDELGYQPTNKYLLPQKKSVISNKKINPTANKSQFWDMIDTMLQKLSGHS